MNVHDTVLCCGAHFFLVPLNAKPHAVDVMAHSLYKRGSWICVICHSYILC